MRGSLVILALTGGVFALSATTQSAKALMPAQTELAKSAVASSDIIEVKRSPHKGRPPGWSRGRKVGWHGRGKPPGQLK